MKEKKNIDRIFQEKFKDFEREPREKIWDDIASKLDKKEKRRPLIIPMWMKLGGVAAVIALIIASLLFTQNQETKLDGPGVVFENPENQEQERTEKGNQKGISGDENPENQVASEEPDEETVGGKSTTSSPENSSNSSSISNNPSKKTNSSDANYKILQKSGIASEEGKNNVRVQQQNEEEKVVIEPEVIKEETAGDIAQTKTDPTQTKNSLEEEKNVLAQVEEEKKNDKKEEEIAEAGSKKIRLSTFAAPVFYKNMGSGNELSSQFSNNASSSEVTLSYGIKVAYELSDKIRIRTGISKLNMSYNIQDISYSPSAIAGSFENIRPSEDNLQIRSNALPTTNMAPESFTQNSLASSIFTPGEINQQFGFIEIPLEIEYVVIDKKFGLNIIGGGSSLFLDRNRVDLVSGNTTTNLGEASNINSSSFSTNIGLGMDYKLNDQFSISLEPIFKYQLNTFENVNNVQPVNFGIYSGLNLKF